MNQADIISGLKHNSLISTSKCVDVGSYNVFTPTEILVYQGEPKLRKIPVWKRWRDPANGLWRVTLVDKVENINTEMRLCHEKEMLEIFHE